MKKLQALLCAIGLTLLLAGCDFGHAYEERVEGSLDTLRHAQQLSEYLQATPWSNNDFGLTFRPLRGMQRLREPEVDANGNVTSVPDPEVQLPPNISLPNRIATFRSYIEVRTTGNQRRLPLYLYVAAATPAAGEGDSQIVPSGAFREQVVAAFRQSFPDAGEPQMRSLPETPVHGLEPKRYEVLTAETSAEFIALRGGRDRREPESVEAIVELYLYEDANRNRAALVFYWPHGTIQTESAGQATRIGREINACLETVMFAS